MQAELSRPTIAVLERLAALFGLSLIEKQAGDFLEDGYLSGAAGTVGWASGLQPGKIRTSSDSMILHDHGCFRFSPDLDPALSSYKS